MSLRTLYLQSRPSAAGHGGRIGETLFAEIRSRSDDCLAAHRVLPALVAGEMEEHLAREAVSEELLCEFAPNLIYIEGGLFADSRGSWKIDWPVIEDLIDSGGVLILADCDARELCRHRPRYEYAARFLRARAQFTTAGVVYATDAEHSWQAPAQIVCQPAKMMISEWLRPAWDGIEEIVVGNPAQLCSWQDLPASTNLGTSRLIEPKGAGDCDRVEPGIFASTARCGLGHVVFLAGEISSDRWTERCPGNPIWLANLAELLHHEALQSRARFRADFRWPFSLFLSHRSVNRQFVARVSSALQSSGVETCNDIARLAGSDSLVQETGRALETMTHFVLFWSRACLGAPWVERELPAAVTLAIDRKLPLMVVRLDSTPVPKFLNDAFRIEAIGMSPQELAQSLLDGIQRIARNARA